MANEVQTEEIALGPTRLRYARGGPRSGPTLLVLHGGGGPLGGLPIFDRLSERYDVVAPVHPGFAGTPIPDQFDGMDDLAYLYLDLLDALELEHVTVLGFSMGGWCAAEIAVRSCARLRALVLVDAVGIKPGSRDERDITDIFALPVARVQALLYHDPSHAPDFSTMGDAELAEMAANRTALAMYTWEPYMHNPKLPQRLHRVTVPVLLLWGESDGIVSLDYARAYQALLPSAELVVIPGAGHLPQVEQPERCVQAIDAFLAKGSC